MTSINGDTVITLDAPHNVPHHATSAPTMVGTMLEI